MVYRFFRFLSSLLRKLLSPTADGDDGIIFQDVRPLNPMSLTLAQDAPPGFYLPVQETVAPLTTQRPRSLKRSAYRAILRIAGFVNPRLRAWLEIWRIAGFTNVRWLWWHFASVCLLCSMIDLFSFVAGLHRRSLPERFGRHEEIG